MDMQIIDINVEIFRIELSRYDIGFKSGKKTVRFCSEFNVVCGDDVDRYLPESGTGDSNKLWRLIDRIVTRYEYDESKFEIQLEGSLAIICPRINDRVHVQFYRGELKGGAEYFEYPEILYL